MNLASLKRLLTVLAFGALCLPAANCSDNDGTSGVCGDGTCDARETPSNCPGDCGYCGNGVAEDEYGEDCDDTDLDGMTCEALGCEPGTLACRPYGSPNACQFDTTACGTCTRLCGNGMVDSGEECDCGTDPLSLPAECTAVNGDPLGECREDCTANICEHEVWDPAGCDPTQSHDQCCPDGWGHEAMCMPEFTGGAFCVLRCESTVDCHYNNFCFAVEGACLPYLCGPNGYGDRDRIHATCQVPGGGQGYCMPIGLAENGLGFCFENGGIASYAVCTEYRPEVNFPRDETGLDVCNGGLCADFDQDGSAQCLPFCDWRAVYDDPSNENPCGAGYNCFSESVIDPQDPDSLGLRTADFSYCRPTEATSATGGITTCDLVDGRLIGNRAHDCTQLLATAVCVPVRFEPPQDCPQCDPVTWGTLIGACADPGDATALQTMEACDSQNPDEVCSTGSFCFPEDVFQAGTGEERCMALCDAHNETTCANRSNVPTYSICRSLSDAFHPGDKSPTRLGLCVCPSTGCSTPQCGNGVREYGELCDGTDTGHHSCEFYGYGGGVMGCNLTCDATDPTNCT